MSSKIFAGFDWKNGAFSQTQEAYLKLYAQTEIESLLACTTDEEKSEYHLKELIRVANLDLENRQIVWCDSPKEPIECVGTSVGDSVRDSVGVSVRESVRDSLRVSVRARDRVSAKENISGR